MGHTHHPAYSTIRLLVTLAIVGFIGLAVWKAVGDLSQESHSLEFRIEQLKLAIETTQTAEDTPNDSLLELRRLESNRLKATNIGWYLLVAAAGLYGIALLCSAMFWHSCLTAFGVAPPLTITVAAHVLGQVGKYIPGKAMVILIRSAALHRHSGIGRIPAAIGVFVETLTMMACGATLAGIAVLYIPAPWWIRVMAAGLAISAAVPTLPPLFHVVLRRLAKSRFGRAANVAVDRYDWRLMLRGWGWMTLTWLLIGGSFWLMALATPGVSAEFWGLTGFATAVATITLAMVAGFLSLIPGGAGVRELVITALLAPIAGTGPAVTAAIIARLIFLLVECIASGLSWLVLNRLPASHQPAPEQHPQPESQPESQLGNQISP